MKILLVAATSAEIAPLLTKYLAGPETSSFSLGAHQVNVLITGVGMVSTAFSLGQELAQNSYDLAINGGIAGSFDRHIPLGKVLHITDDTLAELGAEEEQGFISIDALGFGSQHTQAIAPATPLPFLGGVQKATAITVNKAHGTSASITAIAKTHPVQVESMEGAAFFYACAQVKLPSIQLRAISNWIEPRNRDAWNIPLAIANLNQTLEQLLSE
ncbi:MAG: futalosine hydrolase [Sphingobacteriaceae bacterium]